MNYSALFIPIITLLIAQIIILDLTQFRFHIKKIFAILGIELLLQVTFNGSLLMFFGLDSYGKWYFFTMDIPAILTFFYIAKRRDLRDLFTVLITIFIGFYISIPSMWIVYTYEYGYWWYNLARILIFAVTFFFLHIFFRKRYMQIQEDIEKGWGIFSILPIIGSIIIYYEYSHYSKTGNFTEVLIISTVTAIIMVNVFVVFFYVFQQLHEKYIVQEEKRILFMQNKAQWDQFMQHKEATEKTNRRWHDLRHNTQELIALLEVGEISTAIAYLKEQLGVDEVPKEKYCLHPAVNSTLCLWAERARKAGIDVEIRANVPESLAIEPLELSALFANAFENSYNGCLQLREDIPRNIKVKAHYNGKRLTIGFTNTCRKNIRLDGDMPISSNEGGGIGTRSIIYTVKRFHGAACFEANNGVFSASFVLNI